MNNNYNGYNYGDDETALLNEEEYGETELLSEVENPYLQTAAADNDDYDQTELLSPYVNSTSNYAKPDPLTQTSYQQAKDYNEVNPYKPQASNQDAYYPSQEPAAYAPVEDYYQNQAQKQAEQYQQESANAQYQAQESANAQYQAQESTNAQYQQPYYPAQDQYGADDETALLNEPDNYVASNTPPAAPSYEDETALLTDDSNHYLNNDTNGNYYQQNQPNQQNQYAQQNQYQQNPYQQNQYSQQAYASPVNPVLLEKVVGDKNYFAQEFAKIQNGQKAKFNVSAMFLSLIYCLWKKNTSMFFKVAIVCFITSIINFATAFFLSQLAFLAVSSMLSLVCFGSSIYCGLKFNDSYYKQCKQEVDEPQKSKTGLLVLAIITYMVILCFNVSASSINSFVGTNSGDVIVDSDLISDIIESSSIGSYDLIEYEYGEVVNGVYQNESMNIMFTPADFATLCNHDEVVEMYGNTEAYSDMISYNDDATVMVEVYFLRQDLKYYSEDAYMQVVIEDIYEVKYSDVTYELTSDFEVAGTDFELYEISYYNDEVDEYFSEYYAVKSVAYAHCVLYVYAENDADVDACFDSFTVYEAAE